MADAKIRTKFSVKDLNKAEKFVYRVLLSMPNSSYEGILEYISVVPGTGFCWNKHGELDNAYGLATIKKATEKFFDDGSDMIRADALRRRERVADNELRKALEIMYLREDASIVLRERKQRFQFDNLLLMVLAGGEERAFDRQSVLRLSGEEWMFNTPANVEASFRSFVLKTLRSAEKALMAKSSFEAGPARDEATGEQADRVRALIARGMETASPGYIERRRGAAQLILNALRKPLAETEA